jgi:hypothetical protein
MTAVETMKQMSESLNDKDKRLALKFIEERKFDSLYDLVNSTIYKLVKKKELEESEEHRLDSLREYRTIIVEYLNQLDYNDFSNSDYIDDYEEFEDY